jgi:hypothetical protein
MAGAGNPTSEITARGPISAFVEAACEATKTGSGSSKPDILSHHARGVEIDRTVPFLRYRYPIAARACHSAPLSFAKSQPFVKRGCVDEDCIMGPKEEKTPTPASDVLRDAKDAPLEGLGRIHAFIPSSPLLFNRTVRRPELRKIVPLANTTIYEMEQHG